MLQLVSSGGMVVVKFAWQKLTDARGGNHRCCPVHKAYRANGISRSDMIRRGSTCSFWLSLLGFTCLIFVPALVLARLLLLSIGSPINGLTFSADDAGGLLFGWLFHGSLFGLFLNRYVWKNPQRAVLAMTRAGVCASCGYLLSGCEAEADGCTVCPECGAAWRLHADHT